MIQDIPLMMLGLSFVVFFPGYFISRTIFPRLRTMERFCVSFGLSVFVVALSAFLLTGISVLSNTKTMTSFGVWISLLIVTLIFMLISLGGPRRIT